MNHIEEHILELYVLKSDLVETRREEIEAHLAECEGCRVLKEEIAGYYADLDKSEAESGEINWIARRAIIRRHQYLEQEPFAPPVPYRPTTVVGKLQHFVRRHPVAAGAGTFAAMGALALIGNLILSRPIPSDKNPGVIRLNVQESLIEVYNRSYEKLWTLPTLNLKGMQELEQSSNVRGNRIADLDGDGSNEVIIGAPLLNEQADQTAALHVYSPDKTLRWRIPFEARVRFHDQIYGSKFLPRALVVDDFAGDGKKEIIAIINNERSPNAIVRIADGKIVGEFWHFGQVYGIYTIRMNTLGEKELVICGQNDVADTAKGTFPFIAIIDPWKISGKVESSVTPGFGFPPSLCERFYIRLPLTAIHRVLHCDAHVQNMSTDSSRADEIRRFWCGSGTENGVPTFEYLFTKDMKCVEVKTSNETVRLSEDLRQAGRIRDAVDRRFLDSLKSGIRYWDGVAWRKEPVSISHQGV